MLRQHVVDVLGEEYLEKAAFPWTISDPPPQYIPDIVSRIPQIDPRIPLDRRIVFGLDTMDWLDRLVSNTTDVSWAEFVMGRSVELEVVIRGYVKREARRLNRG